MENKKKGVLYLLPVTLGGDEAPVEKVIPVYNREILYSLRFFVVENIRSARRFIKKSGHPVAIDDMRFFELNKYSTEESAVRYLSFLEKGENMGLLSEAGTPAVADPGAVMVRLAHQQNIQVVPLSGPNSIILALMASGFNGQQFCFHGYLPIETSQRIKKIKELEQEVWKKNASQIFIETPYRNNSLLESIVKFCKPQTLLCVACNLTLPDEKIITRPVAVWKKNTANFHKKPAVFILYK